MDTVDAIRYMRDEFPDKFNTLKNRFCPHNFAIGKTKRDCNMNCANCNVCWDKAISN